MAVREQLAALGWCLSAEGVELLTEGGQVQDVAALATKALDLDLRDIGEAAFPEDFAKEPSKLEKPIVVQIQKIRNVSAPKANEESRHAPRMLKLTLNDGKSSCTGVEVRPLPTISINTPPGTKVLLQKEGLQVQQGIIWLEPELITVLGGRVQHMIDKWELNRSLAKHTRDGQPGLHVSPITQSDPTPSGGVGADGGPPPWISFGQPLEEQAQDRTFKSLQETTKQDNAEFEAQRKGAIAEAQRLAGTKKVFGGGNKPLLDANVQRIVDAGFSEEQADNALKFAKNNVDRALRSLQRRDGSENTKKDKPQKEADPPKRKGRNKENNDDDTVAVKPSGKVSLFDFLEDKLPSAPDRDKPARAPPAGPPRDDRSDRSFSGRERSNSKYNNSRPQGGRYEPSGKYRSDSGHGPRNYSHDGPSTSRDTARDERKYQPHPHERPPRFQRKLEENSRRSQAAHNNYDSYAGSYPPPAPSHAQYAPRTEHRSRASYAPGPVDALAEATADLSLGSQLPSGAHVGDDNSYHSREVQHHSYAVKPTYGHSPALQGSIAPDGMSYRRNAAPPELPKYQESYRRSQMNGYMEPPPPPPVYSNYIPSQQGAYHNGRQGFPYGQRATDTYGGGGRPTYLAGNIVAFQNPAVNEQARSVLGAGDNLHWNVGDRCLALYWEDNNFYEAEVTGTSTNTVVVKFCAYGNHEEVLKTNCLPYPSQGGGGYRAAAPVYAPSRP